MTRFLFGECKKLWCQTKTVNPGIRGEDVATVMMEMTNGMPVYTELSYASILEHDAFTTVFILVEGEKGSIYLGPDFEIRTTTKEGVISEQIAFPKYAWADPDYMINHASSVPLNKNILDDMLGRGKAENTATDNFETVKLVWACYESAKKGTIIEIDSF